MWESKEFKEATYKAMYNPDEFLKLKPHQINILQEMRKEFEAKNICSEIILGTGGECFSGEDFERLFYQPNYKLLLL